MKLLAAFALLLVVSALGLIAPNIRGVFAQATENTIPVPGPNKLLSFGEIEQPTLLTQSGNIYAFWNKDTEEDTFTFFKRSTDLGTSFGKSLNLVASLDFPGLSITGTSLYITWQDYLRNATGGEYNGIFLLSSKDAGATFQNKIMLSQKTCIPLIQKLRPQIITSMLYGRV